MRKKLRDMYFPSSSPFKKYIYIYIYINRQVAFLFGQRRFKEVWLIILKSKIIKKIHTICNKLFNSYPGVAFLHRVPNHKEG